MIEDIINLTETPARSTAAEKELARQAIAADVEAFLARGGKIRNLDETPPPPANDWHENVPFNQAELKRMVGDDEAASILGITRNALTQVARFGHLHGVKAPTPMQSKRGRQWKIRDLLKMRKAIRELTGAAA